MPRRARQRPRTTTSRDLSSPSPSSLLVHPRFPRCRRRMPPRRRSPRIVGRARKPVWTAFLSSRRPRRLLRLSRLRTSGLRIRRRRTRSSWMTRSRRSLRCGACRRRPLPHPPLLLPPRLHPPRPHLRPPLPPPQHQMPLRLPPLPPARAPDDRPLQAPCPRRRPHPRSRLQRRRHRPPPLHPPHPLPPLPPQPRRDRRLHLPLPPHPR